MRFGLEILKQRELTIDPKATGDGNLGFWKALPHLFGATRTNVAGNTRRPCSTDYQKDCKPKPRPRSTSFRWLRVLLTDARHALRANNG